MFNIGDFVKVTAILSYTAIGIVTDWKQVGLTDSHDRYLIQICHPKHAKQQIIFFAEYLETLTKEQAMIIMLEE